MITATEVVRDFSDVLNQINYAGASFIIQRNGKTVAKLIPPDNRPSRRTLAELEALLEGLPRLGDDLDAFKEDVEQAVQDQPFPVGPPWE